MDLRGDAYLLALAVEHGGRFVTFDRSIPLSAAPVAQISFITLLLGLISGVQSVEVSVPPQVAAVELRLDGSLVATLELSTQTLLMALTIERPGGW